MMHIYQEKGLFLYVINSSNRYGRNLAEKPYSQMVLDGIWMDACKWLRIKHQVYATELKNIMERFIQKIKDRTECFDDHFPCRSESCNRQHVTNWIKMFILYLHMKTDRIKLMKFLAENS